MKTARIQTGLIHGCGESFAIISHGTDELANFTIGGSPFAAEGRALRIAEALHGFTHVKVNDGKRGRLSPAKYWFSLYDLRGAYLLRLTDPEGHFTNYQTSRGYRVTVRRLEEAAQYVCDWVDEFGEPSINGGKVFAS